MKEHRKSFVGLLALRLPLIATALIATYHNGYAVAVYIAACAVISLISTAMMPDYTGKDISEEYDAAPAVRPAGGG